MARRKKYSKGKRIFAFVLASLLLLQSMTVYGTEDSSGTDLVVEEVGSIEEKGKDEPGTTDTEVTGQDEETTESQTTEPEFTEDSLNLVPSDSEENPNTTEAAPSLQNIDEEPQPTEEVNPSDGSLAGKTLKFINLYWETDDLGKVEAVFDGGEDEEAVKELEKGKRGVYETTIPKGDYSRVSFRKSGTEEPFEESTYNFYGVEVKDAETETVSFASEKNNTFYYDMGENPSYWGADPEYEPPMPVKKARSARDGGTSTVQEGNMVYFVDVLRVEGGEKKVAEQINIAFMKEGPHDESESLSDYGVGYTMYEKREGIYCAPFPETVNQWHEIGFQLINKDESGKETTWMSRHYNFRNSEQSLPEETWGRFQYQVGLMDTFYINSVEENAEFKDTSYWGAHPSAADDSLDTQVLYVDVTDYTKNGIIADFDNMWLSWEGIRGDKPGAVYEEGKGYKITDIVAKENTRYFQFSFNSNITENTVLTLKFKLTTAPDWTGETPSYDKNEIYIFKFMLIPRSGKNCLRLDNIWEFNGQMWSPFEIGEIKERTIFYSDAKTKYGEDNILMRPAVKSGDVWKYPTEEELKIGFNWNKEQIEKYVEEVEGTTWLKLDKVLGEENKYNKDDLYNLTIPSTFTHVQFRGKKDGKYYYSTLEEINTKVSYPCYYASQTGKNAENVPEGEVDQPGITGFFRSVYSADTSGDQSINIPTDTFVKEENTYYVDSTFYDYYSDWEMAGNKIKDHGALKTEDEDNAQYRRQAKTINNVLQEYYKEKFNNDPKDKKALYLASDLDKHPNTELWGSGGDGKWNDWTGSKQGPYQKIMDTTLKEGKLMSGAIESPLFNEDFLRGNNSMDTAVGNVYKHVQFPFTMDMAENSRTRGYWVYDSARASDALRMSYDADEGYFLKRTKEPIEFRNKNSFFPFNSRDDFDFNGDGKFDGKWQYPIEGWTGNDRARDAFKVKTDCMFGVHFNVEFGLTDDNTIYNEYTKQDDPIRFEFQGDDDTWIYIDGQLALDLGGVHDAVRGEIDFKEGTYTIWRDIGKGNTYEGTGQIWNGCENKPLPEAVLKTLKEKKNHTLSMFYMERGLYESNLKVSFNFPRESTFSVEKEVDITAKQMDGEENIFTEILENMGSFQFRLKNLVTSGKEVKVENSAGYITPGERIVLYNQTTPADFVIKNGSVNSGDDGYTVTQAKSIDGRNPKPEEMLKISPKSGNIDISKMAYLRLAMVNKGANDANARNVYLAFEDENNRRVGGYAATLGYDGENPTFVLNEESILRIDYRRMTGSDNFEWSKVKAMYIGIRKESETMEARYTVSSVTFTESTKEVPKTGFSISEEQISDYGSYNSGTLSPVDGAWYLRKDKILDNIYDNGVSRQTDNGGFTLADGQKAVFADKFRSGSYLALEEDGMDSKVFDTEWTILENGKEVEAKYLLSTRDDIVTVKNPQDVITEQTKYPLSNRMGTKVGDKRQELVDETWKAGNGKFQEPDVANGKTMVYRSYIDPDSTSNMRTDLGVLVKNTLKYGSITIVKKLDEDMKNPDTGKYPKGEYTFDIYYTDIAGLGLETQLTPIDGHRYLKQTVTVSVNEDTGEGQVHIPNIPAGTTYYIKERPSNGADLQKIEIGEEHKTVEFPHENLEIKGVKDGAEGIKDYSKAYVVGTAYASNQSYTFTNKVTPFYMDIEKIWRDDLTDEERAELGIKEIIIQLQRRVIGTDNWQNVTKDYFDEAIGEGENALIKLTAPEWKTEKSKIVLPIKGDEDKYYEYRIQELNEDGTLDNYEVTYEEIRNPNTEDGYMHVTYQAINTSVGLNIVKKWVDSENNAGVRPEKIRMKLLRSSAYDPENPNTTVVWECYKSKEESHTCGDDCYIELTEGSGWRKAISSLPLTDSKGKNYYYKLGDEQIYSNGQWIDAEKEINGYQPTYSDPVHPMGENMLVLSATNTLPLGNIKIEKKDSETKLPLKNAEFTLERLIPDDNESDMSKLEVDQTFEVRKGTTSAVGTIDFYNLPYGIYRIREVKTPTGYILLKKPIYIKLDEEAFSDQAEEHKDDIAYDPNTKTITVTILNEKGLSIPITGGRGILMFTIVGVLLTGAGTLLYIRRQRKLRRVRRRRS